MASYVAAPLNRAALLRQAYTVEADYNPMVVNAADYTPMVVNAEGEDTWLSVDGIIDTVKEVITDKNFLIGGAVGVLAAIGIGLLMGPKKHALASRVGSRVRGRGRKRSKRSRYDW